MDTKDISRRHFIQRMSLFGAAGIGASSLLAACGGGEQQADTPAESPADTTAEAPAETTAQTAEGFTCTDTSGLTEQELAMRNTLQYVDASPDPDKLCDGCALYVAAEAGQNCGACTVIKGPIHPKGSCTSFAPKPA